MSKKNRKLAAKRRINVIKNEFMISNKKKEARRDLKGLQKQVKSQLLKLNIGLASNEDNAGISDIEMNTKAKNRGINFSRSFNSSTPLRARDKRVIQRALKRKRKLVMEIN